MNRILLLAALALPSLVSACGNFSDVLTEHARPAAAAAGYDLSSEQLGQLMAQSTLPDSALTPHWAGELARLWVDYVLLATLYRSPDSTRSVDYTHLIEDRRYLDVITVDRFRDSVVLADVEPTEDEVREYFDVRQPYTRLDVRRLVLSLPDGAPDPVRDSVFADAQAIRDRLLGGADFVAVARERSTEPVQARGQILAYQGHVDFPAVADSVVFDLRPGEISPVIAADDQFLIYRIEARRTPDYETVRDMVYRVMREERREQLEQEALDDMMGQARRVVMRGAIGVVLQVARDPGLAVDRVPAGTRLVTWDGGDLSVEEVRRLFRVRNDLRQLFASASEEEAHDYLMQLARDEILVAAAARSGVEVRPVERERIAAALAVQLARIASELGISRRLVVDPRIDLDAQAYLFLQVAMARARPLPWLGEFRVILDPMYEVRVDDVGVRNAARLAGELRVSGAGADEPEEEVHQEPVEDVRMEVE